MGAASYQAEFLLIIIIGICSESSLEESLMNIHGRELSLQPWRARALQTREGTEAWETPEGPGQ